MKNVLMVDIDTDRKNTVIIGKPTDWPRPTTKEEQAKMILEDMSCLCEAVCTLIHLAEQAGIKNSPDSLRDCLKHLQAGFGEAGYTAFSVDSPSKEA